MMKKKSKGLLSVVTALAMVMVFSFNVFAADMATFPAQYKGHFTASYTRGLQVMLYDYTASHNQIASGGIDGSFGPATERALIQYQLDKGLAGDGSCGPATWRNLKGSLRADYNNSTTIFAYYYMTGNYCAKNKCMRLITTTNKWGCYYNGTWYEVG